MSTAQKPEQEFDAFRDTYADDINKSIAFSGKSQDFFTKIKADHILDLLKGDLPKIDNKVKILDVGCGHGLIHPYLLEGFENSQTVLTGIDVAATVIDVARKDNPEVTYDVYDGLRLPYDDDSFSFAYTICVMHHVPPAQWAAFLREMKRVVKTGGIVAVFEHNPINPLTQYIVRTCPVDENAVLLKSGKLEALFREQDLKDVQKHFILFTPFEHKFFRRFDDAIGWLPLGAQYYVHGRVSQDA